MPAFRRLATGGLAAGALLLLAAGVAMAAEPTTPVVDEGPVTTLTGLVTTATDADGDLEYFITISATDGTVVQMSVGPSWFWGAANPLAQYLGQTVTVTGRMETSPPNSTASSPEFEVYTIAGPTVDGTDLTTTIRADGKPAWAGGPKAAGANHPGYAGWSKGQGNGANAPAQP